MIQKLRAPVTVETLFDHCRRTVGPERVVFGGCEYHIRRIGYHHTYRQGRTLFHVFSVVSGSLFFRLVLNTDNLFWEVEEICDGETD